MNENWTKFIELYLQGELSPEDTAKLEAELQRNPELQQSLALQKQIHEAAKRSGDRQIIKGIRKQYQLQKTIKTSIMAVITAAAIATVSYFVIQNQKSKESNSEVSTEQAVVGKYEQLNDRAELENLPIAYFEHNGNDESYLSPKGILLSVPEKTFLLDGKTYDGKAVIQFQEALDASDIVKAGLSTTSGDRLLETQGMFGLKAFTPDGKELTINNKNGIYLQIPVDENKKGMMLFNGVKTADGSIDWQNPKPIEKLPIQANMLDLDLYPPGYEAKLNEVKWSQKKEKRDSLYLSFEEEKLEKVSSVEIDSDKSRVPQRKINVEERDYLYGENNNRPIDKNMTFEEAKALSKMKNPPADLVGFSAASNQESGLFYVQKEGEKYFLKNKNWNKQGENYRILLSQSGLESEFVPSCALVMLPNGNMEFTMAFYPQQDISVNARIEDRTEKTEPVRPLSTAQGNQFPDPFRWVERDDTPGIKFISTMINRNHAKIFHESKYEIDMRGVIPSIRNNFSFKANLRKDLIYGPIYYLNISFMKNEDVANKGNFKNPLPPSKVLAIWKKDFNKTILATRDFEKRMKAIHGTCNEKVFDVYANQLNKPIWQLDEQVVKMGYANFQAFADERVGGVRLDNAHLNTIRQFYESNVARLKEQAKKDKNFKKALEMAWDRKLHKERDEEVMRSTARVQKVFQEEFNLNLDNVYKQLGKSKTVGVTIYGGGTVYNIDKYVRDATIARKSATITDPETGKTANITYIPFSASIEDAKEYGKLFMYLLPHELSSFQRINPVNGTFDYSLNAAIQYDVLFVGINDQGYFIHERKNSSKTKNFSSQIALKSVSEEEFERTIEKLSKDRQKLSTKSSDMSNELSWLKLERQDYKEQKLRQKNAEFRRMLQYIVFPCATESNYYFYQNPQDSDDENPFF